MVGKSCKVEIAFIKASSSCLSMMLQEELLTTLYTKLMTGWHQSEQVPQIRS
jgi:hypothetical protein